MAAIPAIVRAKQRSRSKSREREREVQQQESDDGAASQQAASFAPSTEPEVVGLISSGIGYYDARGRGLDPNEQEANDGYDDSGLLEDNTISPVTSRGKSRRGKLLGAAVASGLAAKVSRNQMGGSSAKYKNVTSASALPSNSPRNGAEYDESKSDFTAKSSKSLTSALSLLGRRKKSFSKLDSDAALDNVAPSRSVEKDVEGVPSWLHVSRSESEEMDQVEVEENVVVDKKANYDTKGAVMDSLVAQENAEAAAEAATRGLVSWIH